MYKITRNIQFFGIKVIFKNLREYQKIFTTYYKYLRFDFRWFDSS